MLPPSTSLFLWVELAFSEALHLWEFVGKTHVYNILSRQWSGGDDEDVEDDLALLYSVLALGHRLEVGENEPKERRLQG